MRTTDPLSNNAQGSMPIFKHDRHLCTAVERQAKLPRHDANYVRLCKSDAITPVMVWYSSILNHGF